jgi:DNA-binding NtrC family response regulator
MRSTRARILVVEDDEAMASLLRDSLARVGHEVEEAASVRSALLLVGSHEPFDIVITDIRLGLHDGLELVEELRTRARTTEGPAPGIIVITAFGTLETAVQAFRNGASDFLTKPFEMQQLTLAVERSLEARRLKGEIRRLRREGGFPSDGSLVAASAQMKSALAIVRRAAQSDATVLITGPSGSGKEVIAKALHEGSARAEGPFIAVNCAALPEQLLESELFGYRRGAFTDARTNKEGLFQAAAGGTLFLDELADLPLSLQPKLLRVLQERTMLPLGATRAEPVDVRVVGATNQNIEEAVAQRRFREDLYYRVNVIRIELAPLAQRVEDIQPLAEGYLARFARRHGRTFTLSAAAREALLSYRWPGNVRELENALERAATLCTTHEIDVGDLPAPVAHPSEPQLIEWARQRELTLEQLSDEYCLAVVRSLNGNQSAAARRLGIDRKTLARRLHGMDASIDAEPSDDGSAG